MVSSRIIQHEEEILNMALDFKMEVPCVVLWSLLCWMTTIWCKTHTEVVYVCIGGKSVTRHTQELGS